MKRSNFFSLQTTSEQQVSPQFTISPLGSNQNHQKETPVEYFLPSSDNQQLSTKKQALEQSVKIDNLEYHSPLMSIFSHNNRYCMPTSPYQDYYDRQNDDVNMRNKRTWDEADILDDNINITKTPNNHTDDEIDMVESPHDEAPSQDEQDSLLERFSSMML